MYVLYQQPVYHYVLYAGYSSGYNLSTYPQFASLNSEVVEQSNSWIKNIKGSVSYMNSSNFKSLQDILLVSQHVKESH